MKDKLGLPALITDSLTSSVSKSLLWVAVFHERDDVHSLCECFKSFHLKSPLAILQRIISLLILPLPSLS